MTAALSGGRSTSGECGERLKAQDGVLKRVIDDLIRADERPRRDFR